MTGRRSHGRLSALNGVVHQGTGRHRLNRGGHRQANAARYRAVIVRMRYHQPTVDYVARRTAEPSERSSGA